MQNSKMLAITYQEYGAPEVLVPTQASIPTIGQGEMLVSIRATSVTSTEAMFRQGKPWVTRLFTGLIKPKIQILGEEFSGVIVQVGEAVRDFEVGDEIFGTMGPTFGANAEYAVLTEQSVVTKKPENLSHLNAAGSVDGFLTAIPFLRDVGKITSGQSVLIYGASGSVGSAAVQVAVQFGADVTAVCSAGNAEWVRDLGARQIVDYHTEDFTSQMNKYDIIFDAVGKLSFQECSSSLKDGGIFLEASIDLKTMMALPRNLFLKKKIGIAATGLRPPRDRKEDLIFIREMLSKNIFRPVIDRVYPIDDIIAAHHYVDHGHKKGNVVLSVNGT